MRILLTMESKAVQKSIACSTPGDIFVNITQEIQYKIMY